MGLQRENFFNNKHDKKIDFLFVLILLVSLSVLCFLKLTQFYNLEQSAYDLGLQANTAWNALHGYGLFNSIKNEYYLADHFSPIIYLTSLLLLFWNSASVFLILQCFCIILAGGAVYCISKKILKNKYLSVAFFFLYLSNPYLHRVNSFDYHPIALAIPVFIWMLYFLELRKWKYFFLLVLISLCIKENIPIVLGGLSLFMISKKDLRKYGLVLLLTSIGFFIVEVFVITPMYSGGHEYNYYDRFRGFGKNSHEIIMNILFNPICLLKNTYFDLGKIKALLQILAFVGLLPFFSGKYIILLIVPVTMNMMTSYEEQWKFYSQYSACVIPFLIYLSIYGYYNVNYFLKKFAHKQWLQKMLTLSLIVLICYNFTRIHRYVEGRVSQSTLNSYYRACKLFKSTDSIYAQCSLVPYLALRHNIKMIRPGFANNLDNYKFIICNTKGNIWPYKSKQDYSKDILSLQHHNVYKVVFSENGILVMEKGSRAVEINVLEK